MIKQQIALTKTFSYTFQRITVLIRAADLLWPHQEDRARAVLTEAFETATELEKENENKGPRSLILRMQFPDQRYIVIRAIAKRDPRWAKELTRQMLRLGDASPTRDSFSDLLTAERLLDSARNLLSTDINAAIELARASLRYPASFGLTHFLYALARVNQRAADEFYALALSAYASKPIREFLYLQAYPFRLPTSLNTPVFAYYQVPLNLVTTEISQHLQRQFVTLIVQRAQKALEQIYFRRALASIKSRNFEEAERLVSRVKGHEQRAYLQIEIAKTLLNNHEREEYASEVLDQAVSEAKKAGATIIAARTLLTASSLYSKIDLSRSIAVLTDAINCINKIENPDFVRDDQVKENVIPRPGGRGRYHIDFYMPGLDAQTVISQMAKIDFDTALAQSNALTDKLQRALSTLALAEVCQKAQQQSKEKPKKTG